MQNFYFHFQIIFIARNPKDAIISRYHYFKTFFDHPQALQILVDNFLKNRLTYCPMNDHVLEFWKIRNESNVLFLFYEDLKRDLECEVKKVMTFFERNFSQEQIEKLCDHLSFESMQKNPAVNKVEEAKTTMKLLGKEFSTTNYKFVRKGQVGYFKTELTEEQNRLLDDFMNYPEFEKYGFAYKTE
jgi:Sulfotransferase domain